MSSTFWSLIGWRRMLRTAAYASVLAAGLLSAVRADASDTISVIADQATLIKLPDHVATIVVGNPLIADVSLQPGGTMVVTGKGYGTTNVVALDRSGAVLVDRVVEVAGPSDKLVTVFRGVERESYSCTPTCQRRIALGDSQSYFGATLGQAGARDRLAATASASAAAEMMPR
jgi:Flp pilus assembly secretin CpaC